MADEPTRERGSDVRALNRDIAEARDLQIMRIVTLVDAMTNRGDADKLIAPLRQRASTLWPSHPLRFARLLFHPLDPVIAPAARWRPARQAIPRTAIMPMAEHVHSKMGPAAIAIETEIRGRTTAEVDSVTKLGRSLWPVAASILFASEIPATWAATGLGDVVYRPLADAVGTLLAESVALDTLHVEAATGLLPAPLEAIQAILSKVARVKPAVLPMMTALLLDRVPQAAGLLPAAHAGPEAAAIHAAMNEATDLLLHNLEQDEGIETRIATGTLRDAGSAAVQVATLLAQLNDLTTKPRRRDQIRAIRKRLDTGCMARFAIGLQEELLKPLQRMGEAANPANIAALEAAARGLRVLETGARAIGSGSSYDLLLGKAAEAVRGNAARDWLKLADQLRLVEILAGPEAALSLLEQST